jgi:hypothetical protein
MGYAEYTYYERIDIRVRRYTADNRGSAVLLPVQGKLIGHYPFAARQ